MDIPQAALLASASAAPACDQLAAVNCPAVWYPNPAVRWVQSCPALVNKSVHSGSSQSLTMLSPRPPILLALQPLDIPVTLLPSQPLAILWQ